MLVIPVVLTKAQKAFCSFHFPLTVLPPTIVISAGALFNLRYSQLILLKVLTFSSLTSFDMIWTV